MDIAAAANLNGALENEIKHLKDRLETDTDTLSRELLQLKEKHAAQLEALHRSQENFNSLKDEKRDAEVQVVSLQKEIQVLKNDLERSKFFSEEEITRLKCDLDDIQEEARDLKKAINLSKILRDGPDVSLNGSPTVSPTTAAL